MCAGEIMMVDLLLHGTFIALRVVLLATDIYSHDAHSCVGVFPYKRLCAVCCYLHTNRECACARCISSWSALLRGKGDEWRVGMQYCYQLCVVCGYISKVFEEGFVWVA